MYEVISHVPNGIIIQNMSSGSMVAVPISQLKEIKGAIEIISPFSTKEITQLCNKAWNKESNQLRG